MKVSRREFLSYSAASVAVAAIDHRWSSRETEEELRGVAILAEDCRNVEALAGYQAVLPRAEGVKHALVVLPAVTTVTSAGLGAVRRSLDLGATVILESGTGFLAEESDELRRHRALLKDEFDIVTGNPVCVWPADGIPYVEYSWPRAALVRDHSRVIPVESERVHVVARSNGLAVALRRRIGRGTLIFLGAPLGPALLFGDREARQWLSECVTVACHR